MKRLFPVLLLVPLLFLSQCTEQHQNPISSDEGNNNGDDGGGFNFVEITIKGRISGLHKTGDSLSLSDARKVLVYSQNYYHLVDISADTFAVPARFGSGVALIFLTENNRYIGHLSSRGINMLPLGSLVNGDQTVIDLSMLTLDGTTVIPSRDPFGNAILISDQELQTLKSVDGFFESIAKNIDADNDGTPDVLVKKQIVFSTHFNLFGGHWGHNDTIPSTMDTALLYVNYGLEIGGGSALSFYAGNISLKGPVHDPHNDIILWGFMKAPACGGDRGFIASFMRPAEAPEGNPFGSSSLPFRKGTYSLTLDWDNVFTLEYSCLDVEQNLVHVTPTLHTDSLGRLTSVTFEYKLPDGTIVNPASIITNVMLQLSSRYTQFLTVGVNYKEKPVNYHQITMDVPVDISTLESILIGYDDFTGNHYGIGWK